MNNIYRIIILLLLISFTACSSTQQKTSAANGEDRDIGLGGTGLLASTGNDEDSGLGGAGLLANTGNDEDSGLGGTGILGTITGFGSIFVNGIEIEYDSGTAFTVDGKAAEHRKLEVGDVVEVLTVDTKKHTRAQVINLRHEIIGKVESIDLQTLSFTVQGQTVIQPIDNRQLPVIGTTVAVSGFRVDKSTVASTRVVPADDKTSLLRTHTGLPFKEKTSDWLVQVYVQDDKTGFELGGSRQVVSIKTKTGKSYADRLGIRILQLHKPATGELMLEQIIEPGEMPRGQQSPVPEQRGDNKSRRIEPESMSEERPEERPEERSGSEFGSDTGHTNMGSQPGGGRGR